jgi:hypothetical protein
MLQQKDQSLLRADVLQSLQYALHEHLVIHYLLEVERGRGRRAFRKIDRLKIVTFCGQRGQQMEPGAAVIVKEGVHQHTAEPCIKARFSPERVDCSKSTQPYLLGKVFGIMAVAAKVHRKQVDPAAVSFRQLAKGLGVA